MPPVRGPREQVFVLGVEIPRVWGLVIACPEKQSKPWEQIAIRIPAP